MFVSRRERGKEWKEGRQLEVRAQTGSSTQKILGFRFLFKEDVRRRRETEIVTYCFFIKGKVEKGVRDSKSKGTRKGKESHLEGNHRG